MANHSAVRHAGRTRVRRHRPRAERLLNRDIYSYLEYGAWLLPLFAAFVVRNQPMHRQRLAIGVIVAIGVIALGIQAPAVVIGVLVALLPFKDYAFAWLYQLGVGADLLRPMSAWKELALLILALAAIREVRRKRQRIDWLDRFAIGLIGLVVLYYLVPALGATSTTSAQRLVGMRTLGAFPALFLACRHLRVSDLAKERLAAVAVATGTLVAASGIVNYVDPRSWQDFTLKTVHFDLYIRQVQHALFDTAALFDVGRPGGILTFGTVLAAYLVIPVAVAAHRIAKGGAAWWWYIACATCVVAIILTASRAATAASVIAITVAWRRGVGGSGARTRYAILCLAVGIAAAPYLIDSSVASRAESAFGGADASTQVHQSQLTLSVDLLKHHPFGLGLGTGSEGLARGSFSHVSENIYLAFGNEIGVLGLIALVGLTAGLLRRGPRTVATRDRPTEPTLTAMTFGGGLALAALGLVTLDWVILPLAWTFWALAGLGLGAPTTSPEYDHHRPDTARLFA